MTRMAERPAQTWTADDVLTGDIRTELRVHRTRRRNVVIGRICLIVGLIALWQIVSGPPGSGWWVLIDEFYISEPTAMFETLRGWVTDDVLLPNLLSTLQITILGFVIGAVVGMLVGFALGASPYLSAIFSPVVAALYAVPRLALIPLFLLWFGLGIGSKLALVIVVVFFLVFYNTHEGVRDVDRELVNVLRVMNAKRWQIHLKVTFPSAMTWIIAGLRVSVPYALVGAVTGEMTASNEGMGYLIIRASGQFDTAGVFAGIFVLMIFALLLGALVTVAEKRFLRWKPSQLAGP
jgi:sulfonate transport system permease protein